MATGGDTGFHPLRVWLLPLALLFLAAAGVFLSTFLLDAGQAADPAAVLGLLVDPNPVAAASTLANAGEIVAAVLAIAITVVAIVVELAANRYTHRITELFVGAPVNFVVMGFFVITALHSLWVSLTFDYDEAARTGFVPHVGVAVAMVMLALCLLILLPYFRFVFAFLDPISIVGRIRMHTLRVVTSGSTRLSTERKQREAIRGIEQIADVGLNAMEHKDKGVCMASVDALQDLVLEYQRVRSGLEPGWYVASATLAHNPDFVSMPPDVLDEMSRRRVWLEWKVLRQYQTIYNEALNRMGDIDCLVAINTRHIAEAALRAGNAELLALVVKFFNTYLRATINARDIRTGYNVLHQYRLLAESALAAKSPVAVEIARHFKYYGLLAYNAKLPFLLETVAYDLCTLNEVAFASGSAEADALLRVFLEVDKEGEGEVQEVSLRGVRKAQVKLATYYLLRGAEAMARRVFEDMEHERAERLTSIRDELLAVKSSEFWEVSDRGVNFDYLPPDRKERLREFFGWFGAALR